MRSELCVILIKHKNELVQRRFEAQRVEYNINALNTIITHCGLVKRFFGNINFKTLYFLIKSKNARSG